VNQKYNEYVGVLHIHSKYSDGSGSIKKIAKEAKDAGLDYVVITDHNTIKALSKGEEGWHDNVLVLVGEEIGVKRAEHYLALDIKERIHPDVFYRKIHQYIEAVKQQGGLGFVAHPFGLKKLFFRLKIASWKSWDEQDFTGIEIWSYMHDWSQSISLFNLPYYYLYPHKAINGPPKEILQAWDLLCQKRRVVGIGASDVHAKYVFPFFMIQFLSYKRNFHGVRTHLLIESPLNSDLNESKKAVYKALGSGHCFFSYDYEVDSRGFSFEIITDGERLIMGDEYKLNGKAELIVNSPIPALIRLIKDGQVIIESKDTVQLIHETNERGVYRIEALYNNKPWVFTNPIYLR
jgi:hypothetical protein